MPDRNPLRARLACASAASAVAVASALGVASALAAAAALLAPGTALAAPVTPDSATNCHGVVRADPSPTADDPNLVDYIYYCDGPFTAYTILVNRPGHTYDGIDDFESSPNTLFPDGSQITSVSLACSGVLPGDGINCNAGAGGIVPAWATVQGQVDTSDPFCANLPKNAKPGTKAEPAAIAQLVITDATGAQDGPFRLNMSPACKPVKPVPKPTPRTKKTRKRARH